jgi:hypothetical protein
MPSAHPTARDQALSTMRGASAGLAIAALTLTGGVAGLFARQLQPVAAEPQPVTAAERQPQRDVTRRVVVVVHEAPAGAPSAGGSTASPAADAPASGPAPVAAAPVVAAPVAPVAPAVTSSGSDG